MRGSAGSRHTHIHTQMHTRTLRHVHTNYTHARTYTHTQLHLSRKHTQNIIGSNTHNTYNRYTHMLTQTHTKIHTQMKSHTLHPKGENSCLRNKHVQQHRNLTHYTYAHIPHSNGHNKFTAHGVEATHTANACTHCCCKNHKYIANESLVS